MTKRANIQLSGSDPQLRVSRPGVDVDSAGIGDFLLHENYLFSQPYFFDFIPCPFAGYEGGDAKNEIVQVAVPDITDDPIVMVYHVDQLDRNVFPSTSWFSEGLTEGWSIGYKVISSTRIDVRFNKVANPGWTSPNGVYLILSRMPS